MEDPIAMIDRFYKNLEDSIYALIDAEQAQEKAHLLASSRYYEEASKAYRSGNQELWPEGDKASRKGDEEREIADGIRHSIEGKTESLKAIQKARASFKP